MIFSIRMGLKSVSNSHEQHGRRIPETTNNIQARSHHDSKRLPCMIALAPPAVALQTFLFDSQPCSLAHWRA